MMDYEADRMRNLILTDAVIGPERDVILEERRSRIENSPEALLSEEIDATLFQNQPYRIPVIGWMHEMEQLNRVDAVAFYDKYYAPNNAVLVVAGDVDAATVQGARREDLRQGAARPDAAAAHPPDRAGAEHQAHGDAARSARQHAELPEIMGGAVLPTPPRTARPRRSTCCPRSSAAAAAAASTSSSSSRPASRRAPAPPIPERPSTTPTSRSTARRAAQAGIEQVEGAIDAEIVKIIKDGVTDSELEKAKNRYVRSMIFARDNQSGMANIYGATLTTGGTVADVAAWPDRIKAVTADQVKAVAAKYLNPDRSVAGYLLPPAPVQN